ncbi:MAG: ATP-binding protein [Thermoanaerobaculia bacterium]
MTGEILRFARPPEPVVAEIDVGLWITSLSTELAGLLPPKIQLQIGSVPKGLVIHGDRDQLSQVLVNLVSNARDAMPDGGPVVLSIERSPAASGAASTESGDLAHFSVRDRGCGVAAQTIPLLFEPFFTTKTKGTGLGLSIVDQIVRAHHGTISVESVPGEGTTFHLFFPARTSAQRIEEGSRPLAHVPLPRKVVIVEDDATVATGLMAILQFQEIEVEWLGCGEGAAEAIARASPDLVLLDIGLPDISGLEVCRRLAEVRPDIPVIFSTGHGDERILSECPPSRSIRVLKKPWSFEELAGLWSELAAIETRILKTGVSP